MGDPLVSICTPNWNHSKDLLIPFLESMLQTTPDSVEIIICNNGSTDDSIDVLKAFKKRYGESRIQFSDEPKNLGFAGGSNKAYSMARGKYILFLNNDVLATKNNWIQDFIDLWEKKDGKALIGATLIKYNSFTEVLDYGPTAYLNGWCVFGSKEQFEKIGVFDEGFKVGFFEDVELSARAVRLGFELIEIASPGLNHLGSMTIKDWKPDELTVRNYPYFRTCIIINKRIIEGNKRIVFLAPNNYEFNDEDYEGKGVGGAEASLINLTRSLAKKGHEVWVYNSCTKQGIFNGVHYADMRTFYYTDYSDVAVFFRMPIRFIKDVNADIKVFWSTDQYSLGNWEEDMLPFVDRTVAISQYHKWYLEKYRFINPKFIEIIDLGINASDYEEEPEKVSGKIIFCSVPHRGLIQMEKIFPAIRAQVPHAELIITSDYRLWGADPDNQQYKHLSNIDGVSYLGKIPRKDLVRHQRESQLMVYPCNYDELFCISAAECIAAGAVPIVTPIGALTTTVGESGIIVYKDFYDGLDMVQTFVKVAVELLTDEKQRKQIQDAGRKRMLQFYNWDHIADVWLDFFDKVRQHKERGGDIKWQIPKR